MDLDYADYDLATQDAEDAHWRTLHEAGTCGGCCPRCPDTQPEPSLFAGTATMPGPGW